MSVAEIEQAVSKMTAKELSQFAKWFEEYMADEWDRQIERDVAAGKFDKINAKVKENFKAGLSKPL